jgi:hypothetical protein
MIIKIIVKPSERFTTSVAEIVFESLQKAGFKVEVLTKELYANEDVRLRVSE